MPDARRPGAWLATETGTGSVVHSGPEAARSAFVGSFLGAQVAGDPKLEQICSAVQHCGVSTVTGFVTFTASAQIESVLASSVHTAATLECLHLNSSGL